MGQSALARALDAIRRPLDIAAPEEFDPLERFRDLESGLAAACDAAAALAIPRDLAAELRRFAKALNPPAESAERAERLRGLHERLGSWCAPGFGDALLARDVSHLPGVGPKRLAALSARGLGRVGDLLFHLPVRYDDRRSLERVGDLRVAQRATFVAEVRRCESKTSWARGRARRVLRAEVGDDSGEVVLKWFRASEGLERSLAKGARVLVSGELRRYRFDLEIVHPELELLAASAEEAGAEAVAGGLDSLRRVVAEYTAPEGIPPRTLRRWIECAVAEYADVVPGHLPEALAREHALPDAGEALRIVHAPPPDAEVDDYRGFASRAHARLVLEELYLLELGLVLRYAARAREPGIPLAPPRNAVERAVASLPFSLTDAQARAWQSIGADLVRPQPMNRLLQGDVGCGKTAVAFVACVAASAAGYQAAVMAPTELLAEQHARTLHALAAGLPDDLRPRIELLVASLPRARAQAVRAALAAGEVDLVIGTHALVQSEVHMPRLGLAIVDEQHRFGVKQRAALATRGAGERHPHVLVMTATPIPRTLALTLYGDLDISVIDELPPGRSPTRTLLARAGEGRQVAELVREALGRDEQVYVVYPLVEESEKVDLRAATESSARISAAFPEARTELVHGRLDASQRGAAMRRFESGETRILVATSVIEVGVDVPNAALIVVEHAERFGLAQLHQLRGRVGRGEHPGTCVLVARGGGEDSEARLRALLETTDGFAIAEADLHIRGPGEFLGTRQSGHLPDLRVADLLRDARWLALAREAALARVRDDPGLAREGELLSAVEMRWGDRLALAQVG